MTRTLLATAFAAVLAAAAGTVASAAPINDTTYFTFDRSVALPGATLGAGTYIFERVDTASRTDLVRVLSADRSHVYLTQFTRLVDRPAGTGDEPTLAFGEAESGTPPPIAVWYPQGKPWGHAFVY